MRSERGRVLRPGLDDVCEASSAAGEGQQVKGAENSVRRQANSMMLDISSFGRRAKALGAGVAFEAVHGAAEALMMSPSLSSSLRLSWTRAEAILTEKKQRTLNGWWGRG